jgi:hypothetical protein
VALALVAIVVGVTYYLMDLEKEKEKEEMRAELQSEINFSQEEQEEGDEGEGQQSPAHALRSDTNTPSVKSGRRVSSEKFDVKPPAVVSITQTTTVKTTSTVTSATSKKQATIMDRSVCFLSCLLVLTIERLPVVIYLVFRTLILIQKYFQSVGFSALTQSTHGYFEEPMWY